MYHVQLYEYSISSDSQISNFISSSQTNRNETSNKLSYTTALPVIIYRIEIICRRYRSTFKCSQSPHSQYGATQHRNQKLPIQPVPANRQAHGTQWLVSIPPRGKSKRPTLGPRFLVNFPRVGKAIEVKFPTYARGPPPPSSGLTLIDALPLKRGIEFLVLV